jgi:hypothetical protein
MKAVRILVTMTWVALFPLITHAADLTKIDRTIKKEPAYRSKSPNYCLLVFGPAAKFRVWLVFDGDTLYVDRNGNGDLTEPNKRLEPSEKPAERSLTRAMAYEVGSFNNPTTGKKYTQVKIHRAVLDPEYTPRTRKDKERLAKLRKSDPEFAAGGLARIYVSSSDGALCGIGTLRCSTRPEKANILHFDGPMSFQLVDGGVLRRGAKPADFRVELITPGLGKWVHTQVGHDMVPKRISPVAEFEFLSGGRAGQKIKIRQALTGRC